MWKLLLVGAIVGMVWFLNADLGPEYPPGDPPRGDLEQVIFGETGK